MLIKLTKQEIMKEIVRCGKKPEYFIHIRKDNSPNERVDTVSSLSISAKLTEDLRITIQCDIESSAAWYIYNHRRVCCLDDDVPQRKERISNSNKI